MKTGPITPIGASDRPLPVTDSEAGLASAFQNSVRSYSAQVQELEHPPHMAEEKPGAPRQTDHADDSPGLLTLIVKAVKSLWAYFFG